MTELLKQLFLYLFNIILTLINTLFIVHSLCYNLHHINQTDFFFYPVVECDETKPMVTKEKVQVEEYYLDAGSSA